MKRKSIQISIDDPCNERWEDLSPEGKNRYCTSCQKTVVDFASMTDAEIFQYIQQSAGKSMCGSFFPDQLERTILMPLPAKKYRLPVFLGKAAAILLLAQSVCNTLLAQTIHKGSQRAGGMVSHAGKHKKQPVKVKKGITIKGVVRSDRVNDTTNGLTVEAHYNDTSITAITDTMGHFIINIPDTTGVEAITVFCVYSSSKNKRKTTGEVKLHKPFYPTHDIALNILHQLLDERPKNSRVVTNDEIRYVGALNYTPDLVALPPGIYQSRRGPDLASEPPPQSKVTEKTSFWQRLTRPFRRVKK